MRRRWQVAVGAMVVASLALSACSGDDDKSMEFNGQEVANGDKLLSKVESRWQGDLQGEDVNKPDSAQCYFSRTRDSQTVDRYMYCGPVRYLVTNNDEQSDDDVQVDLDNDRSSPPPGKGLWDRYALEGEAGSEDKSVSLMVNDQVPVRRGVDVESNMSLTRPDGETPPKGAEALKPPSGPALPSRFVASMGDFDINDAVEPQDGRLVTPRQTLTVKQAGTVDEIRVDGEVRRPANDEKLHALRVDIGHGPDSEAYGAHDSDSYGTEDYIQADTEYAIQIGDDRRKVTLPEDAESATVIASVPTSVDDATMVATVAGQDQSVALSNGERVSTNAPSYYLSDSSVGLTRQYPTARYSKELFSVSYSATFGDAALVPFDPSLGWAPQGKTWLTISMDSEQSEWSFPNFNITAVDRKKSAVVTPDVGGAVADEFEGPENLSPGLGLYDRLVFPVDVRARQFKLQFAPTLLYAKNSTSSSESGTAKLKPLSLEMKFPAQ